MWVTLLSAVDLEASRRCTHWSDGMESHAYGRVLKTQQTLRLHPDLVHTRDVPIKKLRVMSCSDLLSRPTEIFTVDPHTMQDNGQFARHGNHRTPPTFFLDQTYAPSFSG